MQKGLQTPLNGLGEQGYSDMIGGEDGLIIDAYFSATKLKWILDHVDGARESSVVSCCSERLRPGDLEDDWWR